MGEESCELRPESDGLDREIEPLTLPERREAIRDVRRVDEMPRGLHTAAVMDHLREVGGAVPDAFALLDAVDECGFKLLLHRLSRYSGCWEASVVRRRVGDWFVADSEPCHCDCVINRGGRRQVHPHVD